MTETNLAVTQITPSMIASVMGEKGDIGDSLTLISAVAKSKDVAYRVNKALLQDGEAICSNVRAELFSNLLDAIEGTIGLGKGVFLTSLLHMPERYGRLKLAQWRKGGAEDLVEIDTSLRQGALKKAVADGKYHLAHDVASWMEALNESSFARAVLIEFDRDEILKAGLENTLGEQQHVMTLCDQAQFMRAMAMAHSEGLEEIVRKHMATEIGAKDSSWRGLLTRLCQRLQNSDYDADVVVGRYKAVGAVLVERMLGMDESERKRHLINDDLRLMAYKLGAQSVVREIESNKHKHQVMEVDFNL